jgi:hypothetical protein
MPAVAECVCQECSRTEQLVLVDRHVLTTMPACSCGGRMQVSRVFYDRRIRHEPVLHERRTSDA